MDPFDFSTANFKELQDRLQGQRLAVLSAWRQHGPGTTREVAQKAGIDILSFRPRSTELHQLGLLELVEGEFTQKGEVKTARQTFEGTYRALNDGEVWEMFWARKGQSAETQLSLL
jgi:hypothetical protein